MKLNRGLHLAYCTNVHRGEGWGEVFESLQTHTTAVRDRVCPKAPFGIGLRLSNRAAVELKDGNRLAEFQRWLQENQFYVFTINGFPYGQFHGRRVKENAYRPDWTTSERLAYTNLLCDLLAELSPRDMEGCVSTLPGSFKEFIRRPEDERAIRDNIWRSIEHFARVSEKSGRKLRLALEPEPLCLLETGEETVRFFDQMRSEKGRDPRLLEFLGVNYDTCHWAIEFEEARSAIADLRRNGIRINKIHLSNALALRPTRAALESLRAFEDDVYLHQVSIRRSDGRRVMYRDLADALGQEAPEGDQANAPGEGQAPEWRVHFHVPLHSAPSMGLGNTADHLLGVLDSLAADPGLCGQLEMETYTWAVLPRELKDRSVEDQLAAEYQWTLARLAERGLAER